MAERTKNTTPVLVGTGQYVERGFDPERALDPCFRRGDGSSQAETQQRHSCEILMPRPTGRGTREGMKMDLARHCRPSRGDRPVAPTTKAADSDGGRNFALFSKEAGIQDSQGDLPPLAGLPPKSRPALVEKSEIRCNLFSDLINK